MATLARSYTKNKGAGMAENSTILRGAVSTSKANSKVKYIIGGVIIVALIG